MDTCHCPSITRWLASTCWRQSRRFWVCPPRLLDSFAATCCFDVLRPGKFYHIRFIRDSGVWIQCVWLFIWPFYLEQLSLTPWVSPFYPVALYLGMISSEPLSPHLRPSNHETLILLTLCPDLQIDSYNHRGRGEDGIVRICVGKTQTELRIFIQLLRYSVSKKLSG